MFSQFFSTFISIHALREESDSTLSGRRYTPLRTFLSTPSARRATTVVSTKVCRLLISIHALREESDLPVRLLSCYDTRISIHALREESDVDEVLPGDTFNVFLSTPSARRAT